MAAVEVEVDYTEAVEGPIVVPVVVDPAFAALNNVLLEP